MSITTNCTRCGKPTNVEVIGKVRNYCLACREKSQKDSVRLWRRKAIIKGNLKNCMTDQEPEVLPVKETVEETDARLAEEEVVVESPEAPVEGV